MKINRIKRLFTLVMIVLIITGMTIPASLAANPNRSTTTKISNADELQTYFKNPAGKTGVLMNDITAPKGKAFVLPKGQNATLDLHGKTLTGADGIEVITIDGGNLTLKDTGNTGKITHKNERTEGRGIFMRSGSLVMERGNITHNQRLKGIDWNANGGGVYVEKGQFTMTGGVIAENAAKAGGGVYVEKGTFIMKGGMICGNVATHGGGVFTYYGNHFTMSGGTITQNIADIDGGGGVYCYKGSFSSGSSPVQISENFAKKTQKDNDGTIEVLLSPCDICGGSYMTDHKFYATIAITVVAITGLIIITYYAVPALFLAAGYVIKIIKYYEYIY